MKLALIALALFTSAPAFAVRMADCPDRITLRYLRFEPVSDADLGFDQSLIHERAVFAWNWDHPFQITLNLESTSSGKCDYSSNFPRGLFASRLFTKDGRDLFRADVTVRDVTVWIYHDVVAYGERRLIIKDEERVSVYGGCQTGGCRTKLGNLVVRPTATVF